MLGFTVMNIPSRKKLIFFFEFDEFIGLGLRLHRSEYARMLVFHFPLISMAIGFSREWEDNGNYIIVNPTCECGEHERCSECNGEDELEFRRRF